MLYFKFTDMNSEQTNSDKCSKQNILMNEFSELGSI